MVRVHTAADKVTVRLVEVELTTDHVTEWQLPDTAGDVVPLIPGETDD